MRWSRFSGQVARFDRWNLYRGQAASMGSRLSLSKYADEGCASIVDIEARFAAAPVCPHCRSDVNVIKWDSANRLKRYRCKACPVTFNALTETPLAQLHKRELWIGNAQAIVDGIALRKVAARLDIHVETAFRWRHRFLACQSAPNSNPRSACNVDPFFLGFFRS